MQLFRKKLPKQFFVFLITTGIITVLSFEFKPNPTLDNGNIGDVKYSLIPPDQFLKLNEGWILLDGGSSQKSDSLFKKSSLHLSYGFQTLPDARGVFIRGLNLGREKNIGDCSGDRTVGSPQMDALKDHLHGIKNLHGGVFTPNISVNYGVSILNKNDGGYPKFSTDLTESGFYNPDGSLITSEICETRPRNIALYTYVKIN